MKASRLLSLLLLLQTHGRMTTTDLAARLEVSRRTILRDVEALSASGVPVYAERGRHGGIVLMSEARLNAAHLDPGEIDLLLLAGLDQRAVDMLGVEALARSASAKLASRQPADNATGRLSELVVVDNTPWASAETGADVEALVAAVRAGGRLRIRYRRSGEARHATRVVDPYGLALKGGRWYLVADADGSPRLFALGRLAEHRVLDEPVRRRPGQDLASVWTVLRERAEPSGSILVRARLCTDRLDLARRILGTRLVEVGQADTGAGGSWTPIFVRYDHPEAVRQLLQFGDAIEVLDPPAARQRIRELAMQLVEAHG